MWVKAKDKLTKSKCDEGCMVDSIGNLGESPNLMGQLHITTHPFPLLGLHGLLLNEKFNISRVCVTMDRQ